MTDGTHDDETEDFSVKSHYIRKPYKNHYENVACFGHNCPYCNERIEERFTPLSQNEGKME